MKRTREEEEEKQEVPVTEKNERKSKSPAPRPPMSPTAQTPSRKRQKLTSEPREFVPVDHPSIPKIAGEMFVFGDGDCGQLGLGEDVTERLRPFPLVIEGKKVLQVSAGGMHSVALLEDRSVWSWGVNDEGALGRCTAGKLWEQSGEKGEAQDAYKPGRIELPEGVRVLQVSSGDSHTAFLTDHGAVYICGTFRDSSGVMGWSADKRIALRPELFFELPRSARDRVCKIASGADHVLALTEHGHVYSWGCGQQGQLGRLGERIPERSATKVQLTPGEVHAPKKGHHELKVVDVACGTYSSFLVLADGSVAACGLNNYGQLGLEGEGGEEATVFHVPKLVPGLENVAKVAGGQHHSLALTKDGKVLSFGRPTYGRLGQRAADVGADTANPKPTAVDGLEECTPSAAGVAAGLAVSGCFGAGEGRCWIWGFGSNNQLGNGDDDSDFPLPERIKETKNFNQKRVVQLEFGGQHTLLLAVPRELAPIPEDQAQ